MPPIKLSDDSSNSDDKSFIEQINRDGLLYPNDVVLMAILHIWTLVVELKKQRKAMDLLLSSVSPQRVFMKVFGNMCLEMEATQAVLDLKCQENHGFDKIIM